VQEDDVEDEDEDDNAEEEVEDDDVENEEEDDVEDDDVQEEDRSQDRDPHFGRACAVEMHVDISQEPLYANFTGKMLRARTADHTLCELCASLCSRNALGNFTRDTFYGNLQVNTS
jgi:hypothetical protein